MFHWYCFNAIIYVYYIEKFQLVNDAGRSRCVFARFSKFYSCKLLARLPIYQLTFCTIHSNTLYGTNLQTQHCTYLVAKMNNLQKKIVVQTIMNNFYIVKSVKTIWCCLKFHRTKRIDLGIYYCCKLSMYIVYSS